MGENEQGGMLRVVVVLGLIAIIASVVIGGVVSANGHMRDMIGSTSSLIGNALTTQSGRLDEANVPADAWDKHPFGFDDMGNGWLVGIPWNSYVAMSYDVTFATDRQISAGYYIPGYDKDYHYTVQNAGFLTWLTKNDVDNVYVVDQFKDYVYTITDSHGHNVLVAPPSKTVAEYQAHLDKEAQDSGYDNYEMYIRDRVPLIYGDPSYGYTQDQIDSIVNSLIDSYEHPSADVLKGSDDVVLKAGEQYHVYVATFDGASNDDQDYLQERKNSNKSTADGSAFHPYYMGRQEYLDKTHELGTYQPLDESDTDVKFGMLAGDGDTVSNLKYAVWQ